MRTLGRTTRARVEGWCPTGNRQGADKERIEHKRRIMFATHECLESTDQKQELLWCGLPLFRGHAFGGFKHGLSSGPAWIVIHERCAVSRNCLDLIHDIQ